MPNTYACKGVSNPNVPIFPPRVCTLVLFILYGLVYHLILCVPQGDELSECRCDVSAFENWCVDFRRSMCRPSRIDDTDRCVDLRRWMIDVSTFEDRWSLCRPSKTDDRCEITSR